MAFYPGVTNPFFLLEVVIFPQGPRASRPPQRLGKTIFKVPARLLSQELRRLNRLGAKVLHIYPATELTPLQVPRWWLEIYTDYPRCLYYFGPFDSREEAEHEQDGFLEDLRQEGAENIGVNIKQCQPPFLTQEW